jgi:spore coat protein CotH
MPGGPPGGEETVAASERPPVLKGIKPDQAPVFPEKDLYDLGIVRTIFLDFPNEDWFDELADFYRTDVEVPAVLTVDRKVYKDVGVHFRGNSSYGMAQGKKKSIGVALDFVDPQQNLLGYEDLNLLNANDDPSFLREVLFNAIAREYGPAPKANLVRVVVNGENFGVYVNVQQTDKRYLKENFASAKGVRWKVPPNFSGAAGLMDQGDDLEAYKKLYQIKGSPSPEAADAAWKALRELCRVLKETPPERAVEEIGKRLDVHGALWFLALDNVFMDSDGYYSRGSDYELYLDPDGVMHVLSRDNNETFGFGGGPGGPGGMRGRNGRRGPGGEGGQGGQGGPPGSGNGESGRPAGGDDGPPEGGPEGRRGGQGGQGGQGGEGGQGGPPEGGPEGRRGGQGGPGGQGMPGGQGGQRAMLDPLAQINEDTRPLVRALLSVPQWRARYLAYVRLIAAEQLTWDSLGKRAQALHALIDAEAKRDDKSLYGYAAFQSSLEPKEGARAGRTPALKTWLEARSASLASSPALKAPTFKVPVLGASAKTSAPGNDSSDGGRALVVKARADGEAPAARMVAWTRPSGKGRYVSTPMFDDGKHDDGAAGDGVFGVKIDFDAKTKAVEYYVEAFTANDAVAAYAPKRADAQPEVAKFKDR